MITALTLSLALAAPVPATLAPVATGAAPRVVELKADANGKVMVVVTRTEKVQIGAAPAIAPAPGNNGGAVPPVQAVREMQVSKAVDLAEVKDLAFTQADGMKVESDVAMKKIAQGAIVVMTTDGKPVSPAFLKVFKDDTLVVVSPELIAGPQGGFGGVGKPGIGRPGGVVRPLPAPIQGGVIQIQPGVIQILPAVPGPVDLPAPVDEVAPVAPAVLPAAPVGRPAPALPMVDKIPKPAPVK